MNVEHPPGVPEQPSPNTTKSLSDYPPLPEPVCYWREYKDVPEVVVGSVLAIVHSLFTGDQMLAYVAADRASQASAQAPALTDAHRNQIYRAAKLCAARAFDQPIDNSHSQKLWQSHADELMAIVDALDAQPPVQQAKWCNYCKVTDHWASECAALASIPHSAAPEAPDVVDSLMRLHRRANDPKSLINDATFEKALRAALQQLGK